MEVSEKEKQEPVVINIKDYDNLEVVLSKIIIPLSELLGDSIIPDVYADYKKISFEKRDPLYQTIMKLEFADAVKGLKTGT